MGNAEFSVNVNGFGYSNKRGYFFDSSNFDRVFFSPPSHYSYSNYTSRRIDEEEEEAERLRNIKRKKEEEERKRKEKERQIKQEIKDKLEKAKNNIISEERKKSSFKRNQKIYCEKNIEEILNSQEYNNFLEKILNLENIKNSKETKISDLYTNCSKNFNQNKKYKILLLGKTGVGKSTLINAIFEEELSETGLGEICSKFEIPEPFHSENKPSLILYDSRGIEINEENGEDSLYEKINNFIEDNKEDEEKRIDCIWYCITGKKLEDDEINFLKKLIEIYYGEFPFIIVYTKAINEEDETEYKKIVKELMGENAIFIPIIAKDIKTKKEVIKKFGLDDLLNISQNEIDKNLEHLKFVLIMKKVEKSIKNICERDYFNGNENLINNLFMECFDNKIKTFAKKGLTGYINLKVNKIIRKIKEQESSIKKEYQNSGENNLNYKDIENDLKNKLNLKLNNSSITYTNTLLKGKIIDKLKRNIRENLENELNKSKQQYIQTRVE